jgi:N-acetylglucosaminyl-diphospho-decaprenol L-rhamnosyltransferase
VNGTGPAVSAVVVNYRAAQLTVECVASLRADGVEEIVVVDSGSGDDCEQLLAAADPAALFMSLVQNVGYGAAANAGVRRTGAPVVLVANPDLVVAPGTVAALAGVLAADARVGVVGPRIDRPDGTRYPSARTFPSLTDAVGHGFAGLVTTENRWSRRYLRTEAEDAGPVDWVSGAFFAARRQAWDHVGGFDEDYFMFMEDVDLCWRLRRAGWDVRYEPTARVTHLEGASRASAPYRMVLAHHRSLLRFGWRSGTWSERLVLPVVAVGLVVRSAIVSARVAMTRRGAKRGPRPDRLP